MRITDRLRHAWSAFSGADKYLPYNIGPSYSSRPDRVVLEVGNEQSIIASIYNRIAIDVAAVNVKHIRVDENNRFEDVILSGLHRCLTLSANIDQTGRAFLQDIVMSMCDEGVIAVVPVETSINPSKSASYDILSMRTAKVIEWYPKHVRLSLYNEKRGIPEEITLEKKMVAIIENPLYAIMNTPNSTLKRLIYKLNLLDAIDTQSGSGKLDLIIQLPYVVKSTRRLEQANLRRTEIAEQLAGSKYGIAYADGTEKITQLNRPVENNLMGQIEFLTRMLYSQLGMTEGVFDGTAGEQEMLNYYSRTIEPILDSIADSFRRTFLTRTGRTQGQSIGYFRNPFKLVPASDLAEIADKFTRNEILSSNELRAVVGYKPNKDPRSDELVNKNLNQPEEEEKTDPVPVDKEE